jgi:hypothetical protein
MKTLLNPATSRTTLRKLALTFLCGTALMVLAASAQTPKKIKLNPGAGTAVNAVANTAANNGPPPGAIMDLNGTAIPGGGNSTYQQYTVDFTAADIPSTAITFAFREDPAFISFANASVTDLTTPSGNLLMNGDFSLGTVGGTPVDWTYSNQYGASSGGLVESGSSFCYTYSSCWYDGAVQAYDAISQSITTIPGHNYQISFWVADNSGCSTEPAGTPCNFSDLSTNGNITDTGGNGINVTVYAQAGLPPPNQTLTVNLLDSGTGTVTDNTEAISCSEASGTVTGTCSASYPIGTVVTLTATVGSGSTFAGWGGACSSFGTTTTCTVTMNSALNVTASFDIPGQTVTQPVNTDTQATFNYNGGYPTGTDYIAQLTSGSQVTASVTEITFANQAACNTIFTNTPFAGAQCFVAQNGGTGTATVAYELTCPGYPGTNGTCGSDANANFFATLGSDFSFNIGDNPGLAETPNKTLTYNGGNPLVGFLKYVGPDPLHPCTLSPNSPPVSVSNQISSFTFVDPGALPVKGGSSGTGSCWLVTYGTPGEAPTVAVAAPVNNGVYLQNQNDSTTKANYTCTTVNNGNAATGPYLTGTCSAADTPGGSVANGAQFDTSTPGPHTFIATVTDSAANNASQTVSYDVQGSQTINFPAIPTQTYGAGPLTLNATASSGLPVTYAVTSGPATVIGNILTITGVGSVTVMASQAGNNFYAPATASQTFAVIPASTTTTVTSSLNPSVYGQAVTFTAHVTGAGSPTGSVTWSANTGCGTTALSAGAATCTTSSLTPGTDVVMAAYSGDTNNVASSGTLNQMVSAPQLTLTPTSINFGNVYLFNIAVKTLTLKNTGNATLQISGVSLTFGQADHDFGFVNTCPASLAPGKSCVIYLGFWADQLGIQTGTLVITDNAPGSPQHVAITGNGIKKH